MYIEGRRQLLFEITDRFSGAVLFAMETNSFQRVVNQIATLGPRYWARPVEKTEAEPWAKGFDSQEFFTLKKNP